MFRTFALALLLIVVFRAGWASDAINVLTFNIQMTSEYNGQNKGQMVANLLRAYDIDIAGTQEMQITAVRQLVQLAPEYRWFGVGRDDGLTGGEMGVIYYRDSLFELLEQSTFWLSETPEIPGSKSWGTDNTRMATWGKFRDKRNGNIFYFFNTHLDQISGLARQNGADLIVRKIAQIAGVHPVMLTGDFNCSERETPYKVTTEARARSLQLFDAKYMSATPSFGPSGSYNNYNTPAPSSKIDFIFGNPFVTVQRHGIIDDRPEGIYISDHYPVLATVEFIYPQPPVLPALKATAGDGRVLLQWDDSADVATRQPFEEGVNDFEGYKLYRSTDPAMSDAELIPGGWSTPLFRSPMFQCDLANGRKGYTNYGIDSGKGFYLGSDSGIRHSFEDRTVQNGVTYYYVLTAYDRGNDNPGRERPPLENDYMLEVSPSGSIRQASRNVAAVVPRQAAAGYRSASITLDPASHLTGTATLVPETADDHAVRAGHIYKVKFADTLLGNWTAIRSLRHPADQWSVNTGLSVFDVTAGDSLVCRESPAEFPSDDLVYNVNQHYWHFNAARTVRTEVFDGLRLTLDIPSPAGGFNALKSGWIKGSAPIRVLPSANESKYYAWDYQIVFSGQDSAYRSRLNVFANIRSVSDAPLGNAIVLLGQSFPFTVVNRNFTDSTGAFEKLDMLVHDANGNKQFDYDVDTVLVGHVVVRGTQVRWSGTVFGIILRDAANGHMPAAGDIYRVNFDRPFAASDSLLFSVAPPAVVAARVSGEMEQINVVPNPYILANGMEPAASASVSGQRRLLFTHIPARSTIRIYTVSGVLVDEIQVDNPPDNGTVHWDLQTRSGLDIAAGVYLYHVHSADTGAEKTGKFAILK